MSIEKFQNSSRLLFSDRLDSTRKWIVTLFWRESDGRGNSVSSTAHANMSDAIAYIRDTIIIDENSNHAITNRESLNESNPTKYVMIDDIFSDAIILQAWLSISE